VVDYPYAKFVDFSFGFVVGTKTLRDAQNHTHTHTDAANR